MNKQRKTIATLIILISFFFSNLGIISLIQDVNVHAEGEVAEDESAKEEGQTTAGTKPDGIIENENEERLAESEKKDENTTDVNQEGNPQPSISEDEQTSTGDENDVSSSESDNHKLDLSDGDVPENSDQSATNNDPDGTEDATQGLEDDNDENSSEAEANNGEDDATSTEDEQASTDDEGNISSSELDDNNDINGNLEISDESVFDAVAQSGSASEPKDKEEPTLEPSKVVEDENPDQALVLISKNKNQSADYIKEVENKIDNTSKPIFEDEKGNLYTSNDEINENNKAKHKFEDFKVAEDGEILVFQDGDTVYEKVQYQFGLLNGDTPQYRIIASDGNTILKDWTNWDSTGVNLKYALDVSKLNGETSTHTLSVANRLRDQKVVEKEQGEAEVQIESDYYIGNGTDLNFELQFTPDAGIEASDSQVGGHSSLVVIIETPENGLPISVQQVKLGDFEYGGVKYKLVYDKENSTENKLAYRLENSSGRNSIEVSGAGHGNLSIDLKDLQGSIGQSFKLEIKAVREINGKGLEPDILSRTFHISETTLKDPATSLRDGQKKAGQNDKVLDHYAGPENEDGVISETGAKTIIADLKLDSNTEAWQTLINGNIAGVDSLLRADKATSQELDSLTIVVDLPYDAATGKYAQYDKSALPDNIVYEEIEVNGVKKLRLQLELDKIDTSKQNLELEEVTYEDGNSTYVLKLSQGGQDDIILENPKFKDVILRDGKEIVYIDEESNAFKVNEEFYQELEKTGWKWEGNRLVRIDKTDDPEAVNEYVIDKDGIVSDKNNIAYNLELSEGNLNFKEVKEGETQKKFLKSGNETFSYTNAFIQGLGNVINEKRVVDGDENENTEFKANPALELAVSAAENVINIILDGKYYGGTIYDYQVAEQKQKDGSTIEVILTNDKFYVDGANNVYEYILDEDGKFVTKQRNDLELVKNENKRLVLDHTGKKKDFYAVAVQTDGTSPKTSVEKVWKFFKNTDAAAESPIDYKDVNTTDESLVIDEKHEIKAKISQDAYNKALEQVEGKEEATDKNKGSLEVESVDGKTTYQVILDRYYYDAKEDKFVKIGDNDKVIDGYVYQDFEKLPNLVDRYRQTIDHSKVRENREWKENSEEIPVIKDGKPLKNFVIANGESGYDTEYIGSIDREDYYLKENSVYLLSSFGKGNSEQLLTKVGQIKDEKFINDLNGSSGNSFYASTDVQVVKQLIGQGDDQTWVSYGPGTVLGVFRDKADQIGLKFAGFTPGDSVYNLKTTWKHKLTTDEDKPKDQVTNSIDFTLRSDPEVADRKFTKIPPSVLTKFDNRSMDYEVFNLIFRSEYDSKRDTILERFYDEKSEIYHGKKGKTPLSVDEKRFKEKFENEYLAFFGKAFDYQDFMANRQERMIEWKLRLKNTDPERYPNESRGSLVFEDTHLDNRLVYESLTFNLNRDTFKTKLLDAKDNGNEDLEKALLEAENTAYLEDVDVISLGVDFSQKGGFFNPVEGYQFKNLYEFVLETFGEILNPATKNTDGENEDKRFVTKYFKRNVSFEDNTNKAQIEDFGEDELETEKKASKEDFSYAITFDKRLGQVTLNIRNFFIGKETDNTTVISPIQKAYEEEVERVELLLKEQGANILKSENLDDDDKTQELIDLIGGNNEATKACVKQVLKAYKDSKSEDGNENTALENALKAYKENAKQLHVEELEKTRKLENASSYTNRSYNALRVKLKPGVGLTDKRYPNQNTIDIIVNSTIADNVDIPFTDSYGNKITNKPTLLYNETMRQMADELNSPEKEMFEQLQGKTWDEIKNDSSLKALSQELYAYAEGLAKEKLKNTSVTALFSGSTLNDELGRTYRTGLKKDTNSSELYAPLTGDLLGDLLGAKDLAYVVMTSKDGKLVTEEYKLIPTRPGATTYINPYYLNAGGTSFEDFMGQMDSEGNALLNVGSLTLDIAAYYLSEYGYKAPSFKNIARELVYWVPTEEIWEEPGSKNACPPGVTVCPPGKDGTSGHNINEAPEDFNPAETEFIISHPEEDRPVTPGDNDLDKTISNNQSELDLNKVEDQQADFNIGLKITALTRSQAYEHLIRKYKGDSNNPSYQAELEKLKALYGTNEYAVVEEGSLLIDVLPLGVDTSKLTYKIEVTDAFTANGANSSEGAKKEFEEKIEIIRFKGDIKDLIASYQAAGQIERAARLEKFVEQYESGINKGDSLVHNQHDGFAEGLKGQDREYIIVWFPEFEAPHTDQDIVKLKVEGVKADAHGTDGRKHNRTGFSSNFWSELDYKDFTVTDKSGNFDKFLRLYEEVEGKNGKELVPVTNPYDPDQEWFKGTANLSFGQRFDYRIHWFDDKGLGTATGGDNFTQNFNLTDKLPQVADVPNGFRPVMVGPVEIAENENSRGFRVIYTLQNGNAYEYDAKTNTIQEVKLTTTSIISIENKQEVKDDFFSQVTGLELRYQRSKNDNRMFNPTTGIDVVIPMQTPEFDVVAEDGIIKLEGQDFNLADYLKGNTLEANNTAKARFEDESNTITTKIDELLLQALKLWERDGQQLEGEEVKDLPAVTFNIERVGVKLGISELTENGYKFDSTKEPIVETNKHFGTLTLDATNGYKALVRNLQDRKEYIVYDKDGKIDTEKSYIIIYKYRVREQADERWSDQGFGLQINDGIVGLVENMVDLDDIRFKVNENGELFVDGMGEGDVFSPVQVVSNAINPKDPEDPNDTPPEEPGTPPNTPEIPGEPTTPVKAFVSDEPPVPTKAFVQNLPPTAVASQASSQAGKGKQAKKQEAALGKSGAGQGDDRELVACDHNHLAIAQVAY